MPDKMKHQYHDLSENFQKNNIKLCMYMYGITDELHTDKLQAIFTLIDAS